MSCGNCKLCIVYVICSIFQHSGVVHKADVVVHQICKIEVVVNAVFYNASESFG